jgi:hypothetical protein
LQASCRFCEERQEKALLLKVAVCLTICSTIGRNRSSSVGRNLPFNDQRNMPLERLEY